MFGIITFDCEKIEHIRSALEVYTGEPVRFKTINIFTDGGVVLVSKEECSFVAFFRGGELSRLVIQYSSGHEITLNCGINYEGTIHVWKKDNMKLVRIEGELIGTIWSGTNFANRKKIPEDLDTARFRAKNLKITLEEFLERVKAAEIVN